MPQPGATPPAEPAPTAVQPSPGFLNPQPGATPPAEPAAPVENQWSKDGQTFPESALVAQGWTAATLQANGWA